MQVIPAGNAARREPRSRLPGEQGVWIFVLVDMTFFGLLFVAYVVQQAHERELFAASQAALDIRLGLVNTVVLLTSSWFVALAVAAARGDDRRATNILLVLAIACGIGFTISKAVEYTAKIRSGYSMLTDDFFMFYFVITALHLLHVVAGTVVLLVMARKARAGTIGPTRMLALESSATFWHMVDLLWVMIFPLLYLVRWR
jgi:nitric oxide reductase NorE protein